MAVEQISVNVDSEVADFWRGATDQERRKLELLVNLRLREATRSAGSLKNVMREIGESAQARGLTPEILDEILNER